MQPSSGGRYSSRRRLCGSGANGALRHAMQPGFRSVICAADADKPVQPANSAAHGGFAPAREQVIAETLEANVNAACRPSTVSESSRPPR